MSPELIALIVIATLLALLFSGVPVFASLTLASILGLYLFKGPEGFSAVPNIFYGKLSHFVLVAIPLFILMGEILFYTGIGEDLYNFGSKWLHRIPGGLAMGTVVASTIFGAMCGVSVAGAATIGSFAIPEMLKRGYDRRLASGCVAASGALALLIPPSIGFILYGIIADESIGKLFTGGIIPGVILASMMMAYIGLVVKLDPSKAPRLEEVVTWRERFRVLLKAWSAIFLIFSVLGTIYLGIATPTESAAIGSAGAFFLALVVKKRLTWETFLRILRSTMYTTGMILLIFASAMLFGFVLTLLQVPQGLASFVAELELPGWIVMSAIMALLILMGMFLDGASVILIGTPILLPIVKALGFNGLWFGVVMMVTIEMAVITPPVGLNLYVIKGIAPREVSLEDIIRGALPFVFVEILSLVIFIGLPELVLWLPGKL